MLKETLSFYLIVSCVFVGLATSIFNIYEVGFSDNDVFQIFKIRGTFDPRWYQMMRKINNLLVDGTDSTDLDKNFDIILEGLLVDYKNVYAPRATIEAKRLFLALSTLNEENECNYYGLFVLGTNLRTIGTEVESVIESKNLRRIDKILAYLLKRHINNCREVYFKKFDEISKKLDPIKMERLNLFLEKPMEKLVSEERPENQDKTYVERLFSAAVDLTSLNFEIGPSHIYNTMLDLVKGDIDERFVRKVEDERTGVPSLKQEKFQELFQEYIAEPCTYFRQQLGPNVFEPALFDSRFDRHMKGDRVDFYESWCKYRLCRLDGSIQGTFRRVLYHGNNRVDEKSQD